MLAVFGFIIHGLIQPHQFEPQFNLEQGSELPCLSNSLPHLEETRNLSAMNSVAHRVAASTSW